MAVVLLAFVLQAHAGAATLAGEVVGISDGDTLTLLDETRVQHRIRLEGIDAPERRQAFGQRSKQSLADAVFQRRVTVDWHKRDRYGRIVGRVLLGGLDMNLMQIASGFAWHYKAYAGEQQPLDRIRYAQAEIAAHGAKLGLWQDPVPVPPWEFRSRRR